MNFMLRDVWLISFLEADCKTSLPVKLNFAIPEKVFDMARRGGADMTSASRADLENAISKGRGGVWLNLTPEQYAKLRARYRSRHKKYFNSAQIQRLPGNV
jgi:hypothetical protein